MNSLSVIVYVVTSAMSANTFGLHQVKALVAQGYQVHLICGDGKIRNELNDYCIKIHTLSRLRRNVALLDDLITLMKIFFLLKRIRPKAIIYSTPKAALLSAIASYLSGIKVRIYQIWGLRWQNDQGLRLKLFIFLERMVLSLSTNNTSVSKSIKRILETKISNNNVIVLGNGSTAGVDKNYFFFRQNVNQANNHFKIGYAGRITSEKGIEKLLNLFSSISSEIQGLALELIGDIDGSHEYQLRFRESVGLYSNIKWVDGLEQRELGKKMQNWDLQVFLSEREGLGNVILEAGACGVPTFCWDITGTVDAIPSYMKKFLIEYGDSDSMRNSIIQYIKQPLSLAERAKLSQWYIQNFDQSKVLQNFVNYINELLGELIEK
jgi:glycosyltransferase involved in cell wall biosynthesis